MGTQNDLDAFMNYFIKKSNFSRATFDQLIEDTSEEVAFKILARFKQTLTECKDQIRTGLSNGDGESIWKACHKIAGSADLLGFKSLGATSRRLMKSVQAAPEINESNTSELNKYLADCEELISDIEKSGPNLESYLL